MEMIYPVDIQMEMLLASFVDENGELNCSEEDMQNAIEQMQMEFDDKITQLRNAYKAVTLEAKMVEAEAKTLREEAANVQKRANALSNRGERIKNFLAYLLQGETYKKNGCSITYRKSEELVLDEDFTSWAIVHRSDLVKVEPRKADIKTLLKQGEELEFAHIEEKRNIQVK